MSTPTTARGGRGDTWTRAWHAVGHRVARLLNEEEPVTPDTLPLAVASHASTLRLLVDVHRDLSNRRGIKRPQAPTLELLETNPVEALGVALLRHPATPGVALTDVLTTNPPAGPARLWHDLARAATVAAHEWRSADPTSRPQRDQAWSLMADVGAIGEGLAMLDNDISRAATRLSAAGQELLGTSPGVLSDRYGGAATQGLRSAGERTRLLAAQGPLPDVAPLRQPITRPGAVRFAAHVPGAQDAMVELLGRVDTISPRDLTLLSHAQVKISEHAARLTSNPDLITAARDHATQLALVKPRQLATIETSSDQRPLQQVRALLTYLHTACGGVTRCWDTVR